MVKMGKADSLLQRFDKATEIMTSKFPEARDVIPLDKLRHTLEKRTG
jgi:hypothetical protein